MVRLLKNISDNCRLFYYYVNDDVASLGSFDRGENADGFHR